MGGEKKPERGGNETKTNPESKAGQGYKSFSRSNPQDRSKPEAKQQGKSQVLDPDRLLLGKQVVVKLFDGSQYKVQIVNMGNYWVVMRVLDSENPKMLVVNKAAIMYYEVIGP